MFRNGHSHSGPALHFVRRIRLVQECLVLAPAHVRYFAADTGFMCQAELVLRISVAQTGHEIFEAVWVEAV
jgi:hypothetical protein